MESKGVHALGVARVIGSTRVGIAGAVAKDESVVWRPHAIHRSKGASARLGGVVGWGAPWNDGIVGFTIEAGVLGMELAAGRQVAPYSAVELVFQVPLRSPVRPIAALGLLGVPKITEALGWGAATAELGVVWQAW